MKTVMDENYDFTGMKILVVEDIDMYMEIEAKRLALVGFSVEKANNGKEALEKYLEAPAWTYQAILMDIIMPVLDGRGAATAIRKSGKEDALCVPIISISSDNSDDSIRQSLASGINDFISKPIDFRLLFEKLRGLIVKKPQTESVPAAETDIRFCYNKLWKLLIDRGMTKTQFRMMIGCSTSTLAKLSKNQNVSMKLLKKICDSLDCTLEDIMETI